MQKIARRRLPEGFLKSETAISIASCLKTLRVLSLSIKRALLQARGNLTRRRPLSLKAKFNFSQTASTIDAEYRT